MTQYRPLGGTVQRQERRTMAIVRVLGVTALSLLFTCLSVTNVRSTSQVRAPQMLLSRGVVYRTYQDFQILHSGGSDVAEKCCNLAGFETLGHDYRCYPYDLYSVDDGWLGMAMTIKNNRWDTSLEYPLHLPESELF